MVLYRSPARVVHDRIRAYFDKYLPLGQEISDNDVIQAGGKPGTPRFEKLRLSLITTRLNARPRKIELPEAEPAPLASAARRQA
jgi:hypothetical protein